MVDKALNDKLNIKKRPLTEKMTQLKMKILKSRTQLKSPCTARPPWLRMEDFGRISKSILGDFSGYLTSTGRHGTKPPPRVSY